MNIETALRQAQNILNNKNFKSVNLDCEILMSKVLDEDRKYIILNQKKNLEKFKLDYFKSLVEQRSFGKPIAYLLEKKDFWKSEFLIKKGVLIPRPDTEVIIEQALKLNKNRLRQRILDIGVGSGCILLSLLKEEKNFYGTGIDISAKCISLSKINAQRLGLINRVKFFKSDIDNFSNGKYDLIISNPPYINKYDFKYLDKDIANFEPKLALYGGLDGLSEIRKVIKKSSELIKKNGKLILEIGFDQKNKVKNLLINKGFYINKVVKDLAKNDRCIVCTKI
jgi:release factor glutamine methyltransferase